MSGSVVYFVSSRFFRRETLLHFGEEGCSGGAGGGSLTHTLTGTGAGAILADGTAVQVVAFETILRNGTILRTGTVLRVGGASNLFRLATEFFRTIATALFSRLTRLFTIFAGLFCSAGVTLVGLVLTPVELCGLLAFAAIFFATVALLTTR